MPFILCRCRSARRGSAQSSSIPDQPKRHKTVRHARRLGTVEASFFPRYLFIVLDSSRHRWRSVNGTFGVSRLLMRGDEPHPVPHGIVEALIAAADVRGILQLASKLQVGGPVRLMAGPSPSSWRYWRSSTIPAASGCCSTFSAGG